VQNNGITYRYVTSAGRKEIVESESGHHKTPKTTVNIEKDKISAAKPVRFKAQRHASRKNSGMSVQNEILESSPNLPKNKVLEQAWLVIEEPEYVIHTGDIEFVMTQPETEILRKVRL
jgi:hypothetical protein